MKEDKLSIFWRVWNFVWIVVFVMWILFAWCALDVSNDATVVKISVFFVAVTGGAATFYGVYKQKPDGFERDVKREFSILRKSDKYAAKWTVKRNRENLEQVSQQQTDELMQNTQALDKENRNHTSDEHKKTQGIVESVGDDIKQVIELQDTNHQKKIQLIQRLKSQVNAAAQEAISEVNGKGWLADGTLSGENLMGVNWQGADLKATTPDGAHIAANLRGTKLQRANLQGADMRGIDLGVAILDWKKWER